MKKLLAISAGIAFALSASVASAGVYVSGALPSEFAGGYVSPNPDVFKAAGKASKENAKLAAGLGKCYSKGAGNISKGKASGVDSCVNNTKKGVIPKFLAKIAKTASKSPLPACHNFQVDAPTIRALVKGFSGIVYCQSPSGAFLDQADF